MNEYRKLKLMELHSTKELDWGVDVNAEEVSFDRISY